MKLVLSRLEPGVCKCASNSLDWMLEANMPDLSVQVSLVPNGEYLDNENVFLIGYKRIIQSILTY